MKLKAYDEHDNIHDADALYFDGYCIGERMLEDLPIKIEIQPNGDLQASADWPKGVDAQHWTEVAVRFARQHDVFSTTPELDNDDGFIED